MFESSAIFDEKPNTENFNGGVWFSGDPTAVPYRGKAVPMLKESDPDHIKPLQSLDVKVKKYCITDDAQFKEYQGTLDLIGKLCSQGMATIRYEKFFKVDGKPFVMICWTQLIQITKEENKNHVIKAVSN